MANIVQTSPPSLLHTTTLLLPPKTILTVGMNPLTANPQRGNTTTTTTTFTLCSRGFLIGEGEDTEVEYTINESH